MTLPVATVLQPLIDFTEAIMKFFHDDVGLSWGLSIIFLTFVIRLIILPLTFKQVKSMQEAIEWAKRCPNPTGEQSVLELRPIFEAEDFGQEFTPELREQQERLRAGIEKTQNKKV